MGLARPLRAFAAPMLIGLALGVFSATGDGVDVMLVNGLANAASPWVLASFLAGALQDNARGGAAAGAAALVTGVATYYGGFLLEGHGFLLPSLLAWAAVAAAGGGLFGLAGGGWAVWRDRRRTWAVVLVSGALLAEAIHRLILLEVSTGIEWTRTYMQVATADALAAILLLLSFVERRRWPAALAGLPLAAATALLVFLATDALLSLVTALAFVPGQLMHMHPKSL